jgi:hypothetical protein
LTEYDRISWALILCQNISIRRCQFFAARFLYFLFIVSFLFSRSVKRRRRRKRRRGRRKREKRGRRRGERSG